MTQKLVYKDKRNLFCCESVFQLFNAIVIKMTVVPEISADLMLSEHTDFSNIITKLNQLGIFDNIIQPGLKEPQYEFWNCELEERIKYFQNPKTIIGEFPSKYVYSDFYIPIDHIYWKLLYYSQLKMGYKPCIHFFEEGLRAYTMDIVEAEKREKFNLNYYGADSFANNIVDIFLYEPDLFTAECDIPLKNIPKINKKNTKLINTLTSIFPNNDFPIEKYIFFEESYIGDKKRANDFELFKSIVNIVGKDNIIVKRHPRNTIDRFTSLGYKVMENWTTPWEVQLLTNDVSDKIFITITSTASITPFLLLNQKVLTFHLLNMFEGDSPLLSDAGFNKCYQKILQLYNEKQINIYKPYTMDEVKEILKYIEVERNHTLKGEKK